MKEMLLRFLIPEDPAQDPLEAMFNGLHLRLLLLLVCVAVSGGCNTSSIEPSTSTESTASTESSSTSTEPTVSTELTTSTGLSTSAPQNVTMEPAEAARDRALVAQEISPDASPSPDPIPRLTDGNDEKAGGKVDTQPVIQTVRKVVTQEVVSAIPQVLLAQRHAKLCNVGVGESFPVATLPSLSGGMQDLGTLLGKPANVVLLWTADPWMSRTALIDLEKDIAKNPNNKNISVVGIAVGQSSQQTRQAVQDLKLSFAQLLDTEGGFFSTIGSVALPRVFVLDAKGKIVWFDIEYSEGTRRELLQTLTVLTKTK